MFFFGGGAWRQCRDGFCNCSPEANGRDGGEQSCLGFLGDNPWNPCYLLGGSTALHLCHELYYHCEGIEFWVRYGAIFRVTSAFGHVEGRFSHDFKKKWSSNAFQFPRIWCWNFLKTRQLRVRLNLGMVFFPTSHWISLSLLRCSFLSWLVNLLLTYTPPEI